MSARAISGTTDKRPEFLRMIEDSKKKLFKYVLVYQLDRFARNRFDSATYKAKLKKNGVRVLSAKENITDDASGILIEGVLESMAEYYSVELSQKIKRGIDISASKCQFFGGSVPLGYYIDQDKHYQINENEAVFVRKIYEMYADGKNVTDIEQYLLDNKVFNNGKEIGHATVKRILHNRRYLGYYVYHDQEVKGGIPQLISDELYEGVQSRLTRNKKAPSSKKAREAFLLTTKLFCGLCDCAMTGISGTSHTGAKHYYYKCVGKKSGCKQETVQKDLIEETVIQDTLKLLDDKLIDQISTALYEIVQEELMSGNVERFEKLLTANKKAADNLMQLLMDGKAKNTILEKLDQLEKERKEIELQLGVAKSEMLDYKLEDFRYYVKRFKHLDYTKTENRQTLIDTFVNRVTYLGGKKGKIRYNVTDFNNKGSLYERMVVLTRNELQHFHTDLDNYLTNVFGKNTGVLNEATKDGNQSIEDLKRGTAVIAVKEKQEELKSIENKVNGLKWANKIEVVKEKKDCVIISKTDYESAKIALIKKYLLETRTKEAETKSIVAENERKKAIDCNYEKEITDLKSKIHSLQNEQNAVLSDNIKMDVELDKIYKVLDENPHLKKQLLSLTNEIEQMQL